MPWQASFSTWAGLLPILEAARTIVARDMVDALAWRCALDASTPGDDYARIQFTQRHSQVFPLLVIQPSTSTPELLGAGGVRQRHVFDVEIYLTKSLTPTTSAAGVEDLVRDLVRYADATTMALMSAPDSDWTASLPTGADVGRFEVFCTNYVFGQLEQSKETKGEYLHSVAFELQIALTEAER